MHRSETSSSRIRGKSMTISRFDPASRSVTLGLSPSCHMREGNSRLFPKQRQRTIRCNIQHLSADDLRSALGAVAWSVSLAGCATRDVPCYKIGRAKNATSMHLRRQRCPLLKLLSPLACSPWSQHAPSRKRLSTSSPSPSWKSRQWKSSKNFFWPGASGARPTAHLTEVGPC